MWPNAVTWMRVESRSMSMWFRVDWELELNFQQMADSAGPGLGQASYDCTHQMAALFCVE